MASTDTPNPAYVRTESAPTLPPPANQVGVWGWLWENILSSMSNYSTVGNAVGSILMIILTVGVGWFGITTIWTLIDFAFISAQWSGDDRTYCTDVNQGGIQPEGWVGACWSYVDANINQFIYGRYPDDQQWRVNIVYLLGAVGLAWVAIEGTPRRGLVGVLMLTAFPILSAILLHGGIFGLETVETSLWGGLLVTLVVASVGIVISLPLGVVLALGRQGDLPVIKLLCIIFIEFWRGIPLITVLFMAVNMLPLFMPEGWAIDDLISCLVGVALFASAYMAEVVRGGLQAIPRGQYEGAKALGLSYWEMMRLIVLPQALKHVIPGIVNTFIGLFKDTTLVLIVGLFDLLGQVQATFSNANWSSPVQAATGYLFAAVIFFVFCFGMSRYSIYMEKKLDTGHKR